MNTDLGSDAKKAQREEQRKIDDSEELTEDEQEEKESLLQQVRTTFFLPVPAAAGFKHSNLGLVLECPYNSATIAAPHW